MATGREYQNFDIVIEQSGDKYRARVINSPCGQASVEFDKPFSPLELDNFVLRMGRPRSGMRRIDSPEMHAAKDLGKNLFTTVFSGEVNSCYLRSVDNVLSKKEGLRVRLHINAPEFNDYPWEFLYNPQFGQFVALSQNTPIIRYIELPYTTRALPVQTPLKILVMISSPEGYPKLDIQKEWEKLNKALKPLLDQGLVDLEKLEQPTLSALQKKLRQEKVHIFHYIGHGKYFEDKQDGMLLLEDANQHGRPTSGQHLGAILHDHYHLRLVVLNACEGARTSAEDPYAGVAQTLVQQGIPAVLAMQFEIFEDAAMTFAEEFYSAIVDNYPVDAALSEARKAIFASPNDVEWGTPVLFMRTPDGMLFIPESAEERAARLEAERERQEQIKKEREEKIAREKAEREAAEKAAREKAEREAAEKAAKEKAEKEAKEKIEREAAEKAAREKAEQETAEKAERKAVEKTALEKVEREAAEREKADLEAVEKAARQKAEREAAEQAAFEKAEHEAAEKAAREKTEREVAEKIAKEKAKQEAVEKAAKEKAERQAAEKTAQEMADYEYAEEKAIDKTTLQPRWRNILWIALGWIVGYTISFWIGYWLLNNFLIGGAIGGTFSGIITLVVLRSERISMNWMGMLWITLVGGISLSIGFGFPFAGIYSSYELGFILGGLIGGSLNGFVTAITVQRGKFITNWKNILWFMLVEAVGLAVGLLIGHALFTGGFGFDYHSPFAFGIGGVISGAIIGSFVITSIRKQNS